MGKRWDDHPTKKALQDWLDNETDDQRGERIERAIRRWLAHRDDLLPRIRAAERVGEPPPPDDECLPTKSTAGSSEPLPSYLSSAEEWECLQPSSVTPRLQRPTLLSRLTAWLRKTA